MPRRIDIDGGDPQDEIEEALRQLTQRQRVAQPQQDLERAVQEVAEQQRDAGAARRRAPRAWGGKLAWVGMAIAVLGLLAAVWVLSRHEKPPPPAATAEEAVRDIWTLLIQEKYEQATNYYPQLQQRYGSAAQAGAQLRDRFHSNPPTSIRSVGPATAVPESTQFTVPYEVFMRSGEPRTGELTVSYTGSPGTGYIIAGGGL